MMKQFRVLCASLLMVVFLPVVAVSGDVQIDGSFVSTASTGTPPLVVSSTTGVTNLNADRVDGIEGGDLATEAELATGGSGVTVHWENLTNVPDDGVMEINQACAVVGCFAGDDPGFPVQIAEPGSYRLTSTLDVRGEPIPEDVTAIEIGPFTSGPYDIDLNGFAILGPTVCVGTPPPSCSPTGTGGGIATNSNDVTVRNGLIRGMGNDCIEAVSTSRVDQVRVINCGGHGVHLSGSGVQVTGSVARSNGGDGFRLGSSGLLTGSIALGNIGFGLTALSDSIGYSGNSFGANTAGSISDGTSMGANMCGNALCP